MLFCAQSIDCWRKTTNGGDPDDLYSLIIRGGHKTENEMKWQDKRRFLSNKGGQMTVWYCGVHILQAVPFRFIISSQEP